MVGRFSAYPLIESRAKEEHVRRWSGWATVVVAALSVALVVAATGFASSGASKKGARAAAVTIGVDYPRSDTDFWNSYISYTPKFAKSLGIKLKTTNSANDISKLAANVQTLISQGVKGVVMAPQDTAAVIPTLNQLASKKIPVVSIDTRPDSGSVFMVVRADNRAYGDEGLQVPRHEAEGQGQGRHARGRRRLDQRPRPHRGVQQPA